jgi:transposase, IS30 family
MLVALPNGHKADVVADALAAKITTLPAALTRTLTWDQGHEMAEHVRFIQATGVEVYFCDPKSAWQRGSNENTNGLLRQYLPRTLDFRETGAHIADDLFSYASQVIAQPAQSYLPIEASIEARATSSELTSTSRVAAATGMSLPRMTSTGEPVQR